MAKTETAPRGLRRIFIREGRLRWGWRLPVYVVLLVACVAAISLPLVAVWQLTNLPSQNFGPISMAAYLGGVLLATWLARRFLDKRPLVELGLQRSRGWWREILLGAALGGALMLGIFAVETGLGWARVTGFAWQTDTSLTLVGLTATAFWTTAVVGFNEELYTRGYLMQTLVEGIGLTWAVLVSSALFGLLHLANPNASWISTFNIMLAGVMLAAGYVVTRRLWLSIGLHFGWNFFQGTVFGFPVSGYDFPGLVRLTEIGPDLATGGAFGPEAGLTGLTAMLVGMALIVTWSRRASRHSSLEGSTG